MEKSLSELVEELELLQAKGELLLMHYGKNEVVFQDLVDHIKSTQKVQGEIQNLMIVGMTRFYGRCKIAKQDKSGVELELERQKTISQLGF